MPTASPAPHDLSWLTARPVAHRGLHDAAAGVIENTPSAIAAAIAAGYAIEVDLQVSADGEAMVFHDPTLGRLTEGTQALADLAAAELKAVPFRATADRMMTLGDLLERVDGRATLLLEVKGGPDDGALVKRIAACLSAYPGPAAVMSFDPGIVAAFRRLAPNLTRGIVAEGFRTAESAEGLSVWQRWRLRHLLHAPKTRPQFVAYDIDALPSLAPIIARHLFALPLLTWTVRTPAQRARAERFADAMIFEGFRP